MLERLTRFTQQNRLKCLLMTVAARHLSDDEVGDAMLAGRGAATPQSAAAARRRLFLEPSRTCCTRTPPLLLQIGSLRQIFHFCDADRDGVINLHDLSGEPGWVCRGG